MNAAICANCLWGVADEDLMTVEGMAADHEEQNPTHVVLLDML